ncbi:MAG: TonB-dependent receptor [Deltaproteobacteria bacterium]|nr:TonB-dependent receptor [Deltaproteobacteria bacterium]
MKFLSAGILFCLMVGISISPPAHAQEDKKNTVSEDTKKPEDPEEDINEIVVTARRDEQNAFETDRSLHLLSSEDIIESQGQSLPDVLQETSGVFMQRTNRGAGAPFLRGLVGPQNLILIDGIRFNNSTFRTGPNQYLAMIDPTSIDHLEVMLGPGSVLYGSDAMGGVIHVFPLGWPKKLGLSAKGGTRFVSYDLSTSVWADAFWQNDSAQLLAGGTYKNFERLMAGQDVEQPISDYLQGSWRARGRYEIADDMDLGLTYLGARVRNAGREDLLYTGWFRFYDNDDDFLYFDWKYRPGGVVRELRVAVSLHRTRENIDRYGCDISSGLVVKETAACLAAARIEMGSLPPEQFTDQEFYRDTVWTPGVMATAAMSFWEHRIRATTGLEAYFDFISSSKSVRQADTQPPWRWNTDNRGNFSEGSTYQSLGAFLHADGDLYSWSDQALILGLGGRVSSFLARADDVPGIGEVSYSHTGFVTTVGLRYLYAELFMAYLNFSQGFRAPNLQETTVLGDTGSKFEVPNAKLSPEKSNTLEIGTRLTLAKVKCFVSAFISFMDNVIDERALSREEAAALGIDSVAVGDKPVVQRVNSSSGLYWGVEGTLTLGPWFDTKPWVRIAWIRGEIETQADLVYPARRIPPVMGAAGLRYENADYGFYVEFFTRFANHQTRLHPIDQTDLRICEDPDNLGDTYSDSGQKCPGTSGWITLNLRGGYRFDRFLRVDLAATNLTDKLYHYHASGIDAPGIGVSISLIGSY